LAGRGLLAGHLAGGVGRSFRDRGGGDVLGVLGGVAEPRRPVDVPGAVKQQEHVGEVGLAEVAQRVPRRPEVSEPTAGGEDDTSFIAKLPAEQARPILDGFASSLDTVFTIGGFVILIAFALIWFVKEVPLSNKSGIQRAAEGDQEAVPAVAMH
ncbi:hypothetical protein ACFQ1S_19860, partial [Kibdelosporangium lantanae]